MPFVIKDVLQHKLNDRQIREIHEREYSKYLTNLRQQSQHNPYASKPYYLPSNYINEIERSRSRSAVAKQNQFTRIQRENFIIYDRVLQASKRAMIDDQNRSYQQNLDTFSSKRFQQRSNQYKRIENDNQLLSKRLNNVRGHLINKQQCENDWNKHLNVMKKTCDYPENIDKFVSKMTKNQQKQAHLHSSVRSAQWNNRHFIIEPTTRLTGTPLSILLNES